MLLVTSSNHGGGLYLSNGYFFEKIDGFSECRGVCHHDGFFYLIEYFGVAITKLDRFLRIQSRVLFANKHSGHGIEVHKGILYCVDTDAGVIHHYNPSLDKIGETSFGNPGYGYHVNDITFKDDRMYMTMFDSQPVEEDDGRIEDQHAGLGVLTARHLDDPTIGEIVWSGLCQPHSPVFDGDDLYCCDSRVGLLLKNREPILSAKSFFRGLSKGAGWVGFNNSVHRNNDDFDTSPSGIMCRDGRFVHLPSKEVYGILEVNDDQVRPMGAVFIDANYMRGVT